MAQPIDYLLPPSFKGTMSLEITDARDGWCAPSRSAAGQRAAAGSGGAHGTLTIPTCAAAAAAAGRRPP